VYLETTESDNVVLRTITEDYWQKVIEATKKYRVCALGTPGTGKSTTTCILIRLLLNQNKTIVYRQRTQDKEGKVYVFTPSGNSLNDTAVSVIEEKDFRSNDRRINKTSTYYVVDPEETKDSCNPPRAFKGKVIIVASPDEGHWGASEFDKRRRKNMGKFLYYPAWEEQELIHSAPFINSDINAEEIGKRFIQFGGVPRYIFESELDLAVSKQQTALNTLNAQSVLDLVYTTRSSIKSSASDLPKGILLSYKLSISDGGNFTAYYTELASDYVYEEVADKFMNVLWNRISSSEGTFDPLLYEAYCRRLINCILQVDMAHVFTIRVAKAKQKGDRQRSVKISCTSEMKKVDDIVASAKANLMCLYYPSSKTNKLIDFIFRQENNYNMFQATIGVNHTANSEHIVDILLSLIRDDHDWLLGHEVKRKRKPHGVPAKPKFIFYYMVPDFRFKIFATIPPNASINAKEVYKNHDINGYPGKETILYKRWNEFVEVNILKVPQPQDPSSKINVE
jgi:hypothetical protein